MSHTPGPWGYVYDGGGTFSIGPDDDPQLNRIATIKSSSALSSDGSWDIAADNAKLIASAPTLLAALRAVVAMYGPSSDYGHEAKAMWEQAEAAIAKAEGR
jgi:hypothetical protein